MSDSFLYNESLNEQVYRKIKEKIFKKEYQPGMRLVDSTLAQEYGISRTPARDAIRRLLDEGLVIPVGKKGYCVFQPTEQDILEIYEARFIIERAAIQKIVEAVQAGNNDVLVNITHAYLGMANHVGTPNQYADAAEAFHMSLIQPLNNSRLLSYYKDLVNQTRIFRFQSFHDTEKKERSKESHRLLYEAIVKGDLEGALKAQQYHNEIGMEIDKSSIEKF